jgi:hypothetical protein
LTAAILSALNTVEFLRASILVPGEVVALNAGGSHPQIEFATRDGQRVSYPQNGLIFGMKVGDHVNVRYLAGSPSITARLDRFGAIWEWSIGFGFMGVVGLIVAVGTAAKLLSSTTEGRQ